MSAWGVLAVCTLVLWAVAATVRAIVYRMAYKEMNGLAQQALDGWGKTLRRQAEAIEKAREQA